MTGGQTYLVYLFFFSLPFYGFLFVYLAYKKALRSENPYETFGLKHNDGAGSGLWMGLFISWGIITMCMPNWNQTTKKISDLDWELIANWGVMEYAAMSLFFWPCSICRWFCFSATFWGINYKKNSLIKSAENK